VELLEAHPNARFWYVTTPDSLERLRQAGWRCSRGVSPSEERPDTVIARVIPAAFTAPAPE
jgi:hypothetical protein